jgi:hypothetical protein
LLLVCLAGCKDPVSTERGAGGAAQGSGGAGGTGGVGGAGGVEVGAGGEPNWIVPTGTGGCDTVLYDPPEQASPHVEECSKLEHITNPPTSGAHYGRWADFKSYDKPVLRGFYLHAMEHGAIVLVYNCPAGCQSEVALMQAFIDALPDDRECMGMPRTRILLTPDPKLDVPFAAASWGHLLEGQCFDPKLVGEFVAAHYAMAPEDVCAAGIDPFDPASMVPPDCGE